MKLFRSILPIFFFFLSLGAVGQNDTINDSLVMDIRGSWYPRQQPVDTINDALILNSNQALYAGESTDCRKNKCILIIVAKKTLYLSTIEKPHRIVSYSCPNHKVEHYSTDKLDVFKIYFKKNQYKGYITFVGINGDEMTLKFAKRKYDYVQPDGISALVFNAYTHSIYVKPQPCEQIDAFLYDALSFISQAQPPIKDGAILAEFSVSDSTKVYFSHGNLQYQASTGTWKFADNQYDMIGDNNSNISSSYSGWIDLFGWGTSGWNSGANAYQPYSTSTDYEDYYPGGSYSNNLTGSYANADWGVYNKISNGGNQAGMWRTLTYDEWCYLISTRANASSKKGVARVNGVNGLILLPDEWALPEGIVFTSGVVDVAHVYSEYYATVNSYTTSDWSKMEANGAVFFPAAGFHKGTYVGNVGSSGSYWSSSAEDRYGALYLHFNGNYVGTGGGNRYNGRSVRLVRDVKK